jgi:hypothetical protein
MWPDARIPGVKLAGDTTIGGRVENSARGSRGRFAFTSPRNGLTRPSTLRYVKAYGLESLLLPIYRLAKPVRATIDADVDRWFEIATEESWGWAPPLADAGRQVRLASLPHSRRNIGPCSTTASGTPVGAE